MRFAAICAVGAKTVEGGLEGYHQVEAKKEEEAPKSMSPEALAWAINIEPALCEKLAIDYRRTSPSSSSKKLATKIFFSWGSKDWAEQHFHSLPKEYRQNAPKDISYGVKLLHMLGCLSGVLGLFKENGYFENPLWRLDAPILLAEPEMVMTCLKEVNSSENLTRDALRKVFEVGVAKPLHKNLRGRFEVIQNSSEFEVKNLKDLMLGYHFEGVYRP